jgi:site-specific recombinase XerD
VKECWYDNRAVGYNTFSNTVKQLCESAGLSSQYTNHSLRTTTATRLFEAGVDE